MPVERQRPLPQVHPFVGLDLAHLLEARAATGGDRIFLIWEPFDGPIRRWSFRRFSDEVRHLASALHRRHVRAGDVVLIHMSNTPELMLGWFACARLGAVAATVDPRSTPHDLAYHVDVTGAVGALAQPDGIAALDAARTSLSWRLVADGHGKWDEPVGDDVHPLRPPDPSAPLSLQFTSGTTARPKAVVWTHANALWAARIGASHSRLTSDDIQLVYAPLHHTLALSFQLLSTLWAGGQVVLQPSFSSTRFWEVSVRHGCTWTWMIPFALRVLHGQDVPAIHAYRRWGGIGSTMSTVRRYGVGVVGAWGMTETLTQVVMGSLDATDTAATMGRPTPEYQVSVIDNDGAAVEPGGTGELLVGGIPGLSLFSHYLGDPKLTTVDFDAAGRFCTGDRVTLLEGGLLRFADRSKDMMKIGGENVAASEVEAVIASVPGVAEVAVVGRPDRLRDELPVAFVVAEYGWAGRELADAVIDRCAERLLPFKVPVEVRFVEDLPRSLLAKVAKHELRRMAAAGAPHR